MHMHPSEFYDLVHPLNLCLANGVTTIRSLQAEAGAFFILRWRDEINKGTRIGPKIYSSGVSQKTIFGKETYEFLIAEEQCIGFDFLKLYSGLDKRSYYNLMDIAKQKKIYTIGHIPFPLGLEGITNAGINEIAHIEEVVYNELFEIDRNKTQPSFDLWYADVIIQLFRKYKTSEGFDMKALLSETDASFNKMVASLKQSKIPVHTTLAYDDELIRKILSPKEYMFDEDWNYYPDSYKNDFKAGMDRDQLKFKMFADILSKDNALKSKLKNAEKFALVKFGLDSVLCSKMNKAGCTLIFGTDAASYMGTLPGRSIHREFAMLIKCGLTPYQALLTATVNASKVVQAMNGLDDFGTIELNKRADLILLNKNPLDDIGNLKTLVGTMAAGNWLDKKTLDEMVKIEVKNIPKSGRKELMKTIEEKGLEAALTKYWLAKNTKGNENRLNVSENEMNNLGYDLLKGGKLKEAVEILKLNTTEYPLSWNVWDSYAEALAKSGDIKSAKENYRKAILLNPNSQASIKGLADLDYINAQWIGTNDQKIMGLMTIWGEAKYAFPWFDKLPDLNWDAKVQEFIPRVIEAKDIESYYKVLAEFTNLLCDGHTQIETPWGPVKADDDSPAIEVQVVNAKFLISRVGNTSEIKDQNIYPGLEIVEVEKSIPVKTYFEENVSRYFSADTKQGKNVWSIMIFMGKRGSKVSFKVKEMNGTIRDVKLTRDGLSSKSPFLPIFYQNYLSKTVEVKKLEDGVLYVNIPNFNSTNIENGFQKLIDSIDPASTKGLIIDLRYNGGGSGTIADNIIGRLIEKEADKPLIKYPQYVAYYRDGDKTAELLQEERTIKPNSGKKYTGALVILTGAASESSSEDMAIALQYSKRALLVGEKTAGGAGGSVSFKLPGGGFFKCSTFRSYYPDGKEYVHIGVQPDIEVNYTQKDIFEGKDPILLKGLEVIKNWETSFNKNK